MYVAKTVAISVVEAFGPECDTKTRNFASCTVPIGTGIETGLDIILENIEYVVIGVEIGAA